MAIGCIGLTSMASWVKKDKVEPDKEMAFVNLKEWRLYIFYLKE